MEVTIRAIYMAYRPILYHIGLNTKTDLGIIKSNMTYKYRPTTTIGLLGGGQAPPINLWGGQCPLPPPPSGGSRGGG